MFVIKIREPLLSLPYRKSNRFVEHNLTSRHDQKANVNTFSLEVSGKNVFEKIPELRVNCPPHTLEKEDGDGEHDLMKPPCLMPHCKFGLYRQANCGDVFVKC